MADVVKQLTTSFSWSGPIGITFPGVVTDGVTRTAANLDPSWIGLDAGALFAKATGNQVRVLNDADAAGVAEMTFGAGVGQKGTVLMLTFGTGIGSALFTGGMLVPNTEFGHIEIRGHDAEKRASERAKVLHDMSWGKWAGRVDEYLQHIEALLSPDLIIVGGGISKESEQVGAAADRDPRPNRARRAAQRRRHRRRRDGHLVRGTPDTSGASGTAGIRYLTGWPAPRRAPLTWPMRSVPKWNTLAASTASAPASTAGAKWARVPAPPLAITGTVTTARTARMSSRSKPAVVPSASIEFSRISPAPSSVACRAHSTASIPVPVRPPCVVTSKPLDGPAARRASTDSTMHCDPNRLGRLGQQFRAGRWRRC